MRDSSRQRRQVERARRLVGPEVAAYAGGTGKVRFTSTFRVVASGIGLLLVGATISTGRPYLPGVLVVGIAVCAVRPRRGVAVTPGGLVVLHESMANALPNRVVAVGTLHDIHATGVVDPQHAHVFLTIGPEVVRMTPAAYAVLTAGVEAVSTAWAAAPPGWLTDPTARFDLRYWDGRSWTAHVSTRGATTVDPLVGVLPPA